MIVEDEPLALEVLRDYVSQVPFLHLETVCSDALFALEFLQHHAIDLIFLDIHLPKLKGLDFLQSLRHPPQVIITSAYKEYALEGFDLNVVDYLLKPVRFSRFLKAVNRLQPQSLSPSSPQRHELPEERKFLFFNVGKKRVKIFLDEILHIESLREYIRITTKDKSILTRFALSEIEEQLSQNNFLRVHRSFIVAKERITAYTASEVFVGDKEIPIGRTFKEATLGELNRQSNLE